MKPIYDPIHDEAFSRVVGHRVRRPVGSPPDAEARALLAEMARYTTRAPKGVFRYRTHEEANEAREAWAVRLALDVAETTGVPGRGALALKQTDE